MANSPVITNPYARFEKYEIVSCESVADVDIIEQGLVFDLFPPKKLELYDTTPFLNADRLSANLRPADFHGTLGSIVVEKCEDAPKRLRELRPRCTVPDKQIVGIDIVAAASSTRCKDAGALFTQAFYFFTKHGSYSDVANFPLRRVLTPPDWLPGSRFEQVLEHLGAICRTNGGVSKHSYSPDRRFD